MFADESSITEFALTKATTNGFGKTPGLSPIAGFGSHAARGLGGHSSGLDQLCK
jgi:hypothetical protein